MKRVSVAAVALFLVGVFVGAALAQSLPDPALAADDAFPVRGVAYVFSPTKITIVDPKTMRVRELEARFQNADWSDVVPSPDGKLLFANERGRSQVIVIDVEKREIVKRIDVGGRPVHLYNPHGGGEIWTHADAEGTFYIIDIETLEVAALVDKGSANPSHGKLLWSPELGNKAYATNTGTNRIYIIDLEAKRATGSIEVCQGTHGISYSEMSGYAYVACGGSGTVSVVDPKTDAHVMDLVGGGQVWPGAYDGIMSHQERWMLSPGSGEAGDTVFVIDAVANENAGEIPVGGAGTWKYAQVAGRTVAIGEHGAEPLIYIVDVDAREVIAEIEAGVAVPAAEAPAHGTGSSLGGGYFFSVRQSDGYLSVVDIAAMKLHGLVHIEQGVSRVAYVAE